MDLRTGLQSVVEASHLLTTWALTIVAGSVATIVGTSYLRPKNPRIRLIYLLFIPGWVGLGVSVYFGEQLSRRHIAAQLVGDDRIRAIASAMNSDFLNQRCALQMGLLFFALWLFLFLVWWIFGKWSVTGQFEKEN